MYSVSDFGDISKYSDESSYVLALLVVFAVMLFVELLIGYVLTAIALNRMAKNDGIRNAWLTWIPIGNLFILGSLVKNNFTIFGKKIKRPDVLLPVFAIVGPILSSVPIISIVVAIAHSILGFATAYHLFKKYKGSSAMEYTLVSTFASFVYPYLIFLMRNETPVDLSYSGHREGESYGFGAENYDNSGNAYGSNPSNPYHNPYGGAPYNAYYGGNGNTAPDSNPYAKPYGNSAAAPPANPYNIGSGATPYNPQGNTDPYNNQ